MAMKAYLANESWRKWRRINISENHERRLFEGVMAAEAEMKWRRGRVLPLCLKGLLRK